MGLQCSRQGIEHFDEFCPYDVSSKRLAPEGQCIPSNFVSTELKDGDSRKLQELQELVHTLEKKNVPVTLGEVDMIDRKPDDDFDKILVDLPPEGKTDPDKEFVELPSDEKSGFPNESRVVVSDDVSGETSHVLRRVESKGTVCTMDQSVHNLNHGSAPSTPDNAWSYTLYDFQGKGIATKKDLHQLMESIGASINHHPVDDGTKPFQDLSPSTTTSVIQNSSKPTHTKSPNKYTPSKHYKGLIFPPPNSEEAEKVSCYIEEKLSVHQEKRSRKERGCSEARHQFERNSKENCSQCCCKRPDKFYVIPKRRNLCEGDDKRLTHSKSKLEKLYANKSNNFVSRTATSGLNTPHISEDENDRDGSDHRKNHTIRLRHPEESMRLRHYCSCHQRIKDKLKPVKGNGVDQESNLCKYIKTLHRDMVEKSCDLPADSPRCSASSSDSSNGSTRQSSTKSTIQRTSDHEKPHRNTPKKKICETLLPTTRPAVWPGECHQNEEIPQSKECTYTAVKTNEELCLCKRMLGLDYPCVHGSTVRHKHEHHHYHYHYSHPVDK